MKTLLILLSSLLLFGCSSFSNWEDSLYIVKLQDKESLRQLYRDQGDKVFDWSQYTSEVLSKLTSKCKEILKEMDSIFVGDVRRFYDSLDKKYLTIFSYCTSKKPINVYQAESVCIKLRDPETGMPLRVAWVKKEPLSFACIRNFKRKL